jgi:hypothetical protein
VRELSANYRLPHVCLLGHPNCTSTGSSDRRPVPHLGAKFRRVGRNILVTYTSSNFVATSRALDEVTNRGDARQIGEKLKKYHRNFGGATELLAVAWGTGRELQPLEIMPPNYLPRPITGIVGIGDRGVLSHFRENFVERPPNIVGVTPQMAAGISKAVGREIRPWSAYPLKDAMSHVFMYFSNAVKDAGGATVGLPVQHWIVTSKGPRRLEEVTIAHGGEIEHRSLNGKLPVVFAGSPTRVAQDWTPRAAVQLFD